MSGSSGTGSSEYAVKLPDIGEGVAEAEVVEWRIAVGDVVTRDQPLAEVMTDKASVEITAPTDGSVLRLGGAPGEFLAVGADLVVLAVDGPVEDAHKPNDAGPPVETAAPAAAPAPAAPAPGSPAVAAAPAPVVQRAAPSGKALASPPVRKRARIAGVDLAAVPGTGPRGRVTHADLTAFLEGGAPVAVVPTAPRPSGAATGTDEVTQVKLVGLRRRIAQQMSTAKSEIPHITYVEEVDVTALEELRAHLNAEAAAAVSSTAPSESTTPPKLTLLPLIVAAVRKALVAHPEMNATFDSTTELISQHRAFHCGIAADTPKGLVVPVIRNAHELGVWSVAGEISRLAEGARAGTLGAAELSGSTFTISSLGRLGGVISTPVINHPEVAILGINKVVERPVVVDGDIVVRKMMNLSGSFDHRIVDGMDVALFMQNIKGRLEFPATIFVEPPPVS